MPNFTLDVVTLNDDFLTAASDVASVAAQADVLFVQEAKRTPVRPLLPRQRFGVLQRLNSQAEAGVAVVWRRATVDVARTGERGLTLTVLPDGAAILPRYTAWVRGRVQGHRVLLASTHRPPLRYARLWPLFDAALVARLWRARRFGRFVIVGIDANQRNPLALARAAGLRWVAPAGSIDGFLVSPELEVASLEDLAKGSSDHNPVRARLVFPAR